MSQPLEENEQDTISLNVLNERIHHVMVSLENQKDCKRSKRYLLVFQMIIKLLGVDFINSIDYDDSEHIIQIIDKLQLEINKPGVEEKWKEVVESLKPK